MLLPLLRPEDALRLRREIARELGGPLASTEKAILVWSEILEGDPRDEEALRALADLLGGPGTEARRAAALEQLAAVAVSDAPQLLLEAAGIWWTLLGDAERALRAVERALALDAGRGEAHALRVEICAALGRADPAAASLARLIEGEPAGLSARAWIRLAQALSLLPELHAGASRAAARAVALSKPGEDVRRETQVVLEQVSDWDRLVELLQEEAGAAPPEKARALVQRLARVEWLERHDPARACTAFEALGSFGALDPEDRELYAKALAAQGRWAESLELRRSLLEEQGEAAAAEAWLELASCYLERLDDPRRAAVATDSALARDPTCTEALRLRADLDGALGDAQAEASRREALAERLRDPPAAAHELARAAALAREPLADPQRARRLFLRALDTDPACLAACMGAGELAFEAGEWESAALYLGKALDSLPGSPLEGRRGELARIAAQAAAELGRPAETLALLELALGASPNDPRTLDAGANACLRIEAWQRATDLLKARLAVDGLEGAERAERLVRLGRAAEALGDRATAADALEEALGLTPGDEALRARITQILEDVGDRARLLKHLDDRAPLAPSERGRLLRRAAQIAMELGDRAGARARLEKVVAEHPADSESWHDLVSLVLEDEGPEAALERAAQGLDALGASPGRARLLGLRARVLDSLGRATEAAEAALAALESNPKDQDVARCLAVHSGRTGEWKRTARALERALDLSRFEPALEAQIWDAVGRLYAGPLADLERAERAYRRALASNPEHDRAREALADVTSFDPSRHAESLTLHLALLAKFPARRASWVALERIASHWRRLDARGTCRSILAALANERAAEIGREAGSLLINLRPEKAVEAAIEGARKEAPRGGAREAAAALGAELPVVLRAPLDDLGGPLLSLPDEALCGLLQKAASRLEESSERRGRRRTSVRARRAEPPDALGCRAELLGVAAARTVGAGAMGLREAIESLVTAWPSTSELKLERGADLAEVSQICPPVRVLLLRAAHAVAERLGLGIRAEKE
jgi:tetratricopeptide (TPR) repeat protein